MENLGSNVHHLSYWYKYIPITTSANSDMKYINTVYTCICQTLFYMVGKGCPNVFVQKNMPVLFGIMGGKTNFGNEEYKHSLFRHNIVF